MASLRGRVVGCEFGGFRLGLGRRHAVVAKIWFRWEEAEIFDRVLEATRECTTILISHRFSTVRKADQICVIENGMVIELGSHDELIKLGGRYRTMFDLQASRFVELDDEGEEIVYDTLS